MKTMHPKRNSRTKMNRKRRTKKRKRRKNMLQFVTPLSEKSAV